MKMKIVIMVIVLSLLSTSAAFARGGNGGHHREFKGGIHLKSGHHHGAGIAFGVLGGLLLGSAIIHKVVGPPRPAVYGAPYGRYQQEVNVRQPKMCFEDRVVSGQYQSRSHNGRRIWVQFSHPVTQRFQVPCY